ncbi:DUF6036 family nucleotidyltransferase [Selenihalanaerobacter shriftii]|uniref:DUF6036 domain-containing protein n=1 Tax=Selenihalanaerobacter shriftii TaxID=142842 RepID=A0A1T4QJA1_9FIRM|nr:DUF6036 family nucleotidyltransferase [Selenihalanaerobacter shriftii]SKA03581.1 hypothetical protein SAMN02745118_02580 [Selenihalanaerobacter shriftii]
MNLKQFKTKIQKIINSDRDDLFKKIGIIAVITKVLEELNVKPVIVGGQAVEFYTVGGYTTMDIDLVCAASVSAIDELLKPLGFKKNHKYWELPGTGIVVETPSSYLEGSWEKVAEVEIDNGLIAYIIGIEDIIIDRLNRYKYWQVHSDQEWIIGMLAMNHDDIDWDYLFEEAKKARVLKELDRFKKEANY